MRKMRRVNEKAIIKTLTIRRVNENCPSKLNYKTAMVSVNMTEI